MNVYLFRQVIKLTGQLKLPNISIAQLLDRKNACYLLKAPSSDIAMSQSELTTMV